MSTTLQTSTNILQTVVFQGDIHDVESFLQWVINHSKDAQAASAIVNNVERALVEYFGDPEDPHMIGTPLQGLPPTPYTPTSTDVSSTEFYQSCVEYVDDFRQWVIRDSEDAESAAARLEQRENALMMETLQKPPPSASYHTPPLFRESISPIPMPDQGLLVKEELWPVINNRLPRLTAPFAAEEHYPHSTITSPSHQNSELSTLDSMIETHGINHKSTLVDRHERTINHCRENTNPYFRPRREAKINQNSISNHWEDQRGCRSDLSTIVERNDIHRSSPDSWSIMDQWDRPYFPRDRSKPTRAMSTAGQTSGQGRSMECERRMEDGYPTRDPTRRQEMRPTLAPEETSIDGFAIHDEDFVPPDTDKQYVCGNNHGRPGPSSLPSSSSLPATTRRAIHRRPHRHRKLPPLAPDIDY
ncbi:hypothetical protein CVT25_008453 [Psilocybe cyanescens]|uniref:Uncharacterized protein n=1 Tax=Psilocybe cyanescens TaxID=93625 RepID=A0A409WUW2_PSICY|nr:hypothetical protein CVT25_008453 [Psilocybe cyanescens]